MYKIRPLGYDRIEQNNTFKRNEPCLSMTRYCVVSKFLICTLSLLEASDIAKPSLASIV
jgi:hypothetical protein